MTKNLLKTLLVPGLALALSAPAFAQDGTVTLNETGNGGEAPAADAPAAAAGGKYPVKFAARPLTLPKMTLVPKLDITIRRLAFGGLGGDTSFGFAIGAAFGVIDDLEVRATLIPIRVTPGGGFGQMGIGATYRFMRGNFEVGADLALGIPTEGDFGITPSLVGLLHSGNFRLDVGAGVALVFSDPEVGKELQIPIRANLNFQDAFYAFLATGIFLPNFDNLRVPLGLGAGYTIAKGPVPMLDLGFSFTFDNYLRTGFGDTLNFDSFTVLITGKFYLFL